MADPESSEKSKISRPNTVEEKKRMRNEKKKRKRSRRKILEAQVALERTLKAEADKKTVMYKNMSMSFWERWK